MWKYIPGFGNIDLSKVTAVGNEQFATGGNEYSVHCGGIAIKVKSDKLKRKDFLFLIGVI